MLLHSIIHSFILNIYIAPLQENYSEVLPTQARLKGAVLSWEKNAGDKVLGKIRSWEGSPFQIEGPTTEKARLCLVEVQANGTRRRPCWDERSDRELIALYAHSTDYSMPTYNFLYPKRDLHPANYGYSCFCRRPLWQSWSENPYMLWRYIMLVSAQVIRRYACICTSNQCT